MTHSDEGCFWLQASWIELQQLERPPLQLRRLGQLLEAVLGAVGANAVACQGGELAEQVGQALQGQARGVALARGLGLGGGGALRGSDRIGGSNGRVVAKQQRRESPLE